VLCLIAPVLIYSFTGFNLYETYSLKDPFSYSECSAADVKGAFQFRTCLSTILFNLIILFFLFNYKLTGPLAKKAIIGATCVRVRGGFEGLGDPELDEHHTTPKPIRTAMLQESKNKDTSSSFPPLNLEVNGVPVTYSPEGSNAKHTEKNTQKGYPFWPRIPNLPESNSDTASTSEDKKKVRINGYTEVKEMSEFGLDKTKETKYEIIELGPKKKPKRLRTVERDNNITENSEPYNSAEPYDSGEPYNSAEPSNSNINNIFKGKLKENENKQEKKRNYNFD
jgi:hypothetical protein